MCLFAGLDCHACVVLLCVCVYVCVVLVCLLFCVFCLCAGLFVCLLFVFCVFLCGFRVRFVCFVLGSY